MKQRMAGVTPSGEPKICSNSQTKTNLLCALKWSRVYPVTNKYGKGIPDCHKHVFDCRGAKEEQVRRHIPCRPIHRFGQIPRLF